MPIPKTRDVGKIMDFLKKEHPKWSLAKKRAVALETARRAGAKIPKPKKKNNRPVRFYRVIDRNLKSFGQVDFAKQTMTLNPAKGDMLNTIIHENLHSQYPGKSENWIQKRARQEEGQLTIAGAQRMLGRYKPKKQVPHYRTD